MRKNNHWLFLIATLLGVYLVFGGEDVLFLKNKLLAFAFGSVVPSELDNLKNHNLELEAQLLNLRIGNTDEKAKDRVMAKVYSLYPFSNRSEIVINKGLNVGIKEGMVVVVENKVMVGKVKTVYETSSIVQTIFDKSFKIPVRIGETETDAFYDGGLTAKLSLIDSKSQIKEEDFVLAADKDLPYGLVLGRITGITNATPLKEARLQPVYELKNLRNVVVIVD
jgi:rod shape-determining protein MreC